MRDMCYISVSEFYYTNRNALDQHSARNCKEGKKVKIIRPEYAYFYLFSWNFKHWTLLTFNETCRLLTISLFLSLILSPPHLSCATRIYPIATSAITIIQNEIQQNSSVIDTHWQLVHNVYFIVSRLNETSWIFAMTYFYLFFDYLLLSADKVL